MASPGMGYYGFCALGVMLSSMGRHSFADNDVCTGQGRSWDRTRCKGLERAQEVIGHIEAFFRHGLPQQVEHFAFKRNWT